jgi:hypothetical protein
MGDSRQAPSGPNNWKGEAWLGSSGRQIVAGI